MPFSSSVQLLSCASSNSLLEFKDGSSSTTPWRRGSSTGSSLLLRVCVLPQFHFTHQKLLQYTSLLPRAHPIETEAALRDLCNCKLSCVVPLSLSSAFFSSFVCLLKNGDLISLEANRKFGHILCKTQYPILVSM
jgi:hypothetical protein